MKKTNSKKRKLEEDITVDFSPLKLAKTNPAKKSGRREQVEKLVEAKHSNPGKQKEKSDLSEIEGGKKRKHAEEQELTAESSGNSKRMKLVYVLFSHASCH